MLSYVIAVAADGKAADPGLGGQPPRGQYLPKGGMTELPDYPDEGEDEEGVGEVGVGEEGKGGVVGTHARPQRPASAGNDKLYMVLGIVLGSLVLILITCSIICCLRQRHHAKRQGRCLIVIVCNVA